MGHLYHGYVKKKGKWRGKTTKCPARLPSIHLYYATEWGYRPTRMQLQPRKTNCFQVSILHPENAESIRDTMIVEIQKKSDINEHQLAKRYIWYNTYSYSYWFAFILAVLVVSTNDSCRWQMLAMHTFGISKSKCSKNDCLRQPENAESKSISKPSSTKARKTR